MRYFGLHCGLQREIFAMTSLASVFLAYVCDFLNKHMRPWVFDDEFLRISHNFPSRELKLVYSIKKTIFLISVFSTFDL